MLLQILFVVQLILLVVLLCPEIRERFSDRYRPPPPPMHQLVFGGIRMDPRQIWSDPAGDILYDSKLAQRVYDQGLSNPHDIRDIGIAHRLSIRQ